MKTKRECGTCTKCCEGWLSGTALGYSFYRGKPCHLVSIGKGCTAYDQRPQDPCISYTCGWLASEELPEWMKPSEINAIVDFRSFNTINYIRIVEAGESLRADVLSWIIEYVIKNRLNLYWTVKGANYWIGSEEFCREAANGFVAKPLIS